MITKSEKLAEKKIDAAMQLQEDGDLEGAAQAFLDILELTPKDWRLPDEAGNLYLFHLGRPSDALACYQRALPLVVEPLETWHKIGFAHAMAGQHDKAVDAFNRALQIDETHVLTHLEMGKLLLQSGDYQDALEFLDTALAHHVMKATFGVALGGPDPNGHVLALILMNKARVCLLHLGHVDAGIGVAETLFDDLEDYERGVTLAEELVAAKKSKIAVRVLDALLARAPRNPAAKRLRAALTSAPLPPKATPNAKAMARAKPKRGATASKQRA